MNPQLQALLAKLVLIEEGLLQLLNTNANLILLVAPSDIYLNSVPEKASDPAFCFSKVSSTPDTTMDGPSGLNFRRYQFDCFSQSYPTATQVQALIAKAINGFSGLLPNGQRVFNIIKDNELDGFNAETLEHRTVCDYLIQFND
jgi:hypothetical protein